MSGQTSTKNEFSTTLVLLAAGMGSRYGGLKQMDPMGPNGETLLDYTVFDAVKAGFDRILFVIRKDFAREFSDKIIRKYDKTISVHTAFQEMDDLPEPYSVPTDRVKPWGTGHALWVARNQLTTPFAVLNADDFYGADSLRVLHKALIKFSHKEESPPTYAMVAFALSKTLSENGTVSRGICHTKDGTWLDSIEEVTTLSRENVGPGRAFSPNTPVSMNCWGFTPSFLPELHRLWKDFLRENRSSNKAEFYLPFAVDQLLGEQKARVQLLSTKSRWFGMTYKEDKALVQKEIGELVAQGEYR